MLRPCNAEVHVLTRELNNSDSDADIKTFILICHQRTALCPVCTLDTNIIVWCAHDFTQVKEQSRLDVKKYSLSHRIVNEWKELPADCIHSRSIAIFKNRIGNYLVRAGYT